MPAKVWWSTSMQKMVLGYQRVVLPNADEVKTYDLIGVRSGIFVLGAAGASAQAVMTFLIAFVRSGLRKAR